MAERIDWNKYVDHETLLNKAHEDCDVVKIKTKLVEHDRQAKYAMFKAQVELPNYLETGKEGAENKVFIGHGDADTSNTNAMTRDAYIRMAETRAINRALRFATNTGKTSAEEIDKWKPKEE